MKLKVLSWNIWCDGYMDEISTFLDAANADIICLQEVLPNDKTRDVLGYMKERGYHYAYADAIKHDDGWSMGNAIFTKHEITRSATYILSEKESRNAVSADIIINGQALHVFSVHLFHTHQKPSDIQVAQADTLMKAIPVERTIVRGDFNATPDSEAIQKMRRVLTDTDPSDAPTWSMYAAGCPECKPEKVDTRLDYIFTTKDIKAEAFVVGQSKGSDHLPILVTIDISN
jgi:endonuclease/exonuclease/phosphatase family metal-dependent hydrolase